MPIKIYEYANCDTCRKALKYLDQHKVAYQRVAIVEQPPSPAELKKMLGFLQKRGGTFKNLFNTSGQVYRELKIGDQLKAGLGETEALKLMAANGKLIKRPFLLTDKDGVVGFKPGEWDEIF